MVPNRQTMAANDAWGRMVNGNGANGQTASTVKNSVSQSSQGKVTQERQLILYDEV